jgi:PKD repeat protein
MVRGTSRLLVGGGVLLLLLPLLAGCEWQWGGGHQLVAAFTYEPTSGPAPLTVHFDASPSQNADYYFWDFGDGSIATGMVVEHTYVDPGRYTVTLTVTNEAGASDTASAIVEVTGEPPPPIQVTGIAIEIVGPYPWWYGELPPDHFPNGVPLRFTLLYEDRPDDNIEIYAVYWRVDRIDPALPFYDQGEGNPWVSDPPYTGGSCGEDRPYHYRVFCVAYDTSGKKYRIQKDFWVVSQGQCG